MGRVATRVSHRRRNFTSRGLHRILPPSIAVDDVRVDIEKYGLHGLVFGLFVDGKVELPPVRERQEWGIAERDAFAELSLEPAEKAVEAAAGRNAKWGERFSRVCRVITKINIVDGCGVTERDERLAGSAHDTIGLEEPFAEGLEIEIVVAGREASRAERVRRKRHQKC